MNRFPLILFACVSLFAGPVSAAFADAPAVHKDLQLDEENIKKSNALGYFARSVFLAYQGGPDDRIKGNLIKALNELPESKILLNQVAMPYLRQGDFKGLVDMLIPIAREHPDTLPLHVFLGFICKRANMPAVGIEVFEHIFYDLNHYDPFVIRELSAFYWAADTPREIPLLLRRASRKKELKNQFVIDFIRTLYHEGMAARKAQNGHEATAAHHNKQAAKHALRAAELYGPGESLKSCNTLAEALISHEQYATAARLLNKAAKQFPEHRLEILTRRVEYLILAGEEEAARDQVLAFNVSEIKNPESLTLVGQAAFRTGELHVTRQAYEQAIQEAPGSPSIRYAYAVILQYAGQPEASLDILDNLPEQTAGVYERKARVLSTLRRWNDAEAAWEKAQALALAANRKSFRTVSFLLLGTTIKDSLGHGDAAIALAREAVDKDPTDPVAANYLGYTLADREKALDEAEKLILFALSKDPRNEAYLDSLAWVYYRQSRWEEAGHAMARCLEISGDFNDPVVLDHAGDIFAASGALELARYYWLLALQKDPENPRGIQKKIRQS